LPATSGSRNIAALGFRSHSGWAVLVAVAGSARDPTLVIRRRVVLSQQTPRQPFHEAEGKPFAAAQSLVRRSTEEATSLGQGAVHDAIAELRAAGHEARHAGLLTAAGRALPDLREILASHALIHAAEGELFRDILRGACERCGLAVTEVREKELEQRAAQALRRSAVQTRQTLAAWGKAFGPPWTQDEKRAALVAWVALATSRPDPI